MRPPPRSAPTFVAALQGVARRGDYVELLDRPDVPPAELAENLAHLRLLNRWLGWSAAVWQEVRTLLPPGTRTATLLDVATGSADVPRTLVAWAAREGIRLHVVGTDLLAPVLAQARRSGDDVALVQHDAAALPFRDHSMDVVTLCLAAHHLDPPQLVRALADMWRVARRGVVVSDLERSAAAYVGARLMALVLRNRLTAHDGPLSVLRAYTAPELHAIARQAGLKRLRVRRRFPFRMTLVAKRAGGSGRWTMGDGSEGAFPWPAAHGPLPRPEGAPCRP